MHQTFYIDVDEEITSIVDRLRKAKTKNNIFVIPKLAFVLQSAVNLKVLKKEALRFEKKIMIVTQDKLGMALAKKVGIATQSSLDGIEGSDELKSDKKPKIKSEGKKVEDVDASGKKKKMLESIGSDSFFPKGSDSVSSIVSLKNESSDAKEIKEDKHEVEKEKNSEMKKNANSSEEKNQRSMSDIFQSEHSGSPSLNKKNLVGDELERKVTNPKEMAYAEYEKELDPKKEEELDELFQSDRDDEEKQSEKENKNELHTPIAGKLKKIFILFGVISILAVFLVGLYLFFPKADVKIKLSSRVQSLDLNITGNIDSASADEENKVIAARLINKEKEKTLSFNATGKKMISDRKSRGMVTIYNENDNSPQPLVATTRLLTEDDKLFRLVKGVTVPGMTEVGGKMEPGVIEVEVIADEPGENYNIGPSRFSIPGFKGSAKYEKFYAKSSGNMVGGGSSGDEVSTISNQDLDNAKAEMEKGIMDDILSEIQGELKEGEMFIKDSVEISSSNLSLPEEGSVTDSFEVNYKIISKVLVFFENDLRKIVEKNFSKNDDENLNETVIEYGESNSDFENNTISIKVHGKALFEPQIDREKIKSDLLGKNEKQLNELIGNYTEISEIEVEFWPEFLPGKIPSYAKRVNVEIISPDFE